MRKISSLARAGQWFLQSGIQEDHGGVARYYQSDVRKNKPVSNEITGYTASTLIYLFTLSGDELYLTRARQTAGFLIDRAWNPELRAFPFEHPSPSPDCRHHTYFFDTGIIIRGLLAVWRHTRDERLLDTARTAAHAMVADFRTTGDCHPILDLPSKQPLPRDPRWSRSAGCYQLKSALSWLNVSEITGDKWLESAFFAQLDSALATHTDFLKGLSPHATMDRLHAYCYFLEALIPVLSRPECTRACQVAVSAIAKDLERIGPSFTRCDVRAQLLRARLYAASILPVEPAECAAEADAITGVPGLKRRSSH